MAAGRGTRCFNPLPSPKQGETSLGLAPLGHSGCFNPLPSPKQGETDLRCTYRRSRSSFNPLPSPKQGETKTSPKKGNQSDVSIRSPHQSKGRPDKKRMIEASGRFQSAPLTKARGDADRSSKLGMLERFQSAPLTKARGDRRPYSQVYTIGGFNPLPSPKQGETMTPRRKRCYSTVSIRSPHQSKGRHKQLVRCAAHYAKFQSAPLTKARGDKNPPARA